MPLDGTSMCQTIKAGDWADLVISDKLTAWTSKKLRECYSEVEQEDEERKSIVQQINAGEHGHLEPDHRASRRTGRGHIVVGVPSLPSVSI